MDESGSGPADNDALTFFEGWFFALSPDLLCVVGPDARFQRLNPAWEQTLGYSVSELKARPALDVIHPEDRQLTVEIGATVKDGTTVRLENRVVCRDGSQRWISWTIQRAPDPPARVFAVGRDVTDDRLAREGLVLKTAELEAVFKALPDLVFRTDELDRIVDYSAGRLSDLYVPPEAFLGKTFHEVLPGELGRAMEGATRDATRTGDVQSIEYDLTVPAGTQRFEARVVPFRAGHSITVVRNVNDRWVAQEALRQSEERLRQSEKLEAVGRLAGGIAHDFNNLMMVVLMYSDTVLKSVAADDDDNHQALLKIRGAGERAARLTRQLLAFAARQVLSPTVLDPRAVVQEMEATLRGLIADHISLSFHSERELWSVSVDRSQLEQVVLNLALNARDAMPQGGSLGFSLKNVVIDDAHPRRPDLTRSGEYIELVVGDTGGGIAPEALPYIFEPFFTTKRPGQVAGLGLATVYGIVRQSGGCVSVESSREGASFTILLPRATDREPAPLPPPLTAPRRGAATIMVVDDETPVRRALVGVILDLGYSVLEADSGEAALRIAAEHQGALDLLLTDLLMPGLNGDDLATQLVGSRPSTRVLFMSGYASTATHGTFSAATLQKPFHAAELAEAIARALDPGPTRSPEGLR